MAVATVVLKAVAMAVADSATAAVDSAVDLVVDCSASDQTTERKAKTTLMAVGIVPRRYPSSLYRQLTRAAAEMRGSSRGNECRCQARGAPRRHALGARSQASLRPARAGCTQSTRLRAAPTPRGCRRAPARHLRQTRQCVHIAARALAWCAPIPSSVCSTPHYHVACDAIAARSRLRHAHTLTTCANTMRCAVCETQTCGARRVTCANAGVSASARPTVA